MILSKWGYRQDLRKRQTTLHNSFLYYSSNVLTFICLFFQFKTVFKASKNASYREKFSKNILGGGCAGTLSLCFVQSIDYTRTRLATDAKCASGKRQFNGIIDVYVKTVKSDGIKGLYRGFLTSSVCIFIYRGLYFGLYDSLKPILLKENPLWVHTFLLGWAVTITSGLVRNVYVQAENEYRIILVFCFKMAIF